MDEGFIRKQDFPEVLMKIALNPAGLDVAWTFVRYDPLKHRKSRK